MSVQTFRQDKIQMALAHRKSELNTPLLLTHVALGCSLIYPLASRVALGCFLIYPLGSRVALGCCLIYPLVSLIYLWGAGLLGK